MEMKPEDYRQLLINPGTLVGLIGDDAPPEDEWSHGEHVIGVLTSYVVIERHHAYGKRPVERVWDAAAFVSLTAPLQTTGWEGEYSGDTLLVYHRYPDLAWDSDCIMFVFGIHQGGLPGGGPLPLSIWRPQTVLLSGFATMTVQDGSRPSSFLEDRKEWKKRKEK